ncbi:MAG: hypothetical protein K8T10_07690 [Candidatus Eremiobacteraeota bacterium]|nr:hypothetical protein [Candidatus Eremiobacteraeota bacterium]
MIGDKLIIETFHTQTAKRVVDAIKDKIKEKKKYSISVGGESGSGKSELAFEIHRLLFEEGIKAGVLQQDDYFIFPSKTCHQMRLNNIEQVGAYEARLDFMEANIYNFKEGMEKIYKPLSIYDEDRLTTEFMVVKDLDVLIAEGTFCTQMRFIDTKVFINRDYRDSKEKREKRARDVMGDFIERVLQKEHKVVSEHKKLADIVVKKDFSGIDIQDRVEVEGPYRTVEG